MSRDEKTATPIVEISSHDPNSDPDRNLEPHPDPEKNPVEIDNHGPNPVGSGSERRGRDSGGDQDIPMTTLIVRAGKNDQKKLSFKDDVTKHMSTRLWPSGSSSSARETHLSLCRLQQIEKTFRVHTNTTKKCRSIRRAKLGGNYANTSHQLQLMLLFSE